MSRVFGAVRFKDGEIKFLTYEGIVGKCAPSLYETYKEAMSCLDDAESAKCGCDDEEEVEVYSSYANGFWWRGRACRRCGILTDRLEPSGEVKQPFKNESDNYYYPKLGRPDWYYEMIKMIQK